MNTYLKAAEFLGNIFSAAPIIFTAYFIIINIISFAMFYADKQKAKKHLWRIPEATLLLTAFIGGSIGACAAMKLFRHKTKHPKFYILVPVFIILHVLVIVTGIIGIL
ncbi:MAG: DUF1294 domain-containing protein [Porcipelethomonas sp.]